MQRARGDDSFVLPVELFEAFDVASLDVNGATCSGYSESGKGAEVNASGDLTTLVGFPVPGVTCEVGAKVSASRGNRSMLVLRRLPRAIANIGLGPSLGFFQFSGARWTAGAGASVELAVGPPDWVTEALTVGSEDGPEEISLNLEATAGLSASGAGELYSAIADSPDFFERSLDAKLQKQFAALMPEWQREEVKEECARFLSKASQECRNLNLRAETRTAIPKVRGKYASEDLLAKLSAAARYGDPYAKPAAHLQAQLQAFQASEKHALKSRAANWLQAFGPPQNVKNASKDLKNAIDSAMRNARLPDYARESGVEISDLLSRWVDGSSESPNSVKMPDPLRGLAHFSLFSLGGEGSAGVEAQAKLKMASARTGASVAGRLKRTQFRFQCWSGIPTHPGTPLVQTQDVCLHYKQVEVTAEAVAKVPKFTRQYEGSRVVYNSLHWTASIAQWAYPGGAGGSIKLWPGSGFVIGMSMVYSRLLAKSAGPGRDAYLQNLARALGIERTDFDAFLSATPFLSNPNEALDLPGDVILLEAAFAPLENPPATLSPAKSFFKKQSSSPLALDTGVLKRMRIEQKRGRMPLQSISARYRTADFEDNSKTKLSFKLGLREVARVGITLRSMEEAGFDSVIDLSRWWADPRIDAEWHRSPQSAYDMAIPGVALFHQ